MNTTRIFFRCNLCGSNVILDMTFQGSGSVPCPSCHAILFGYQEIHGFIYILSNDHMPGLLKIGYTTRSVSDRVAELNAATGVPAPFQIEAWFASTDATSAEKAIHDRLSVFRVQGKEFFELDLSIALNALESVLGYAPGFCRFDPRPKTKNKEYIYRFHGNL